VSKQNNYSCVSINNVTRHHASKLFKLSLHSRALVASTGLTQARVDGTDLCGVRQGLRLWRGDGQVRGWLGGRPAATAAQHNQAPAAVMRRCNTYRVGDGCSLTLLLPEELQWGGRAGVAEVHAGGPPGQAAAPTPLLHCWRHQHHPARHTAHSTQHTARTLFPYLPASLLQKLCGTSRSTPWPTLTLMMLANVGSATNTMVLSSTLQ